MPFKQRNAYVAIFINIIVIGFFAMRINTLYQGGEFSGPDALSIWAKTVLWMIPVSIIATIILTILFNIIYAIITHQPKPSFVVDERDRNIEINGMRVTLVVSSAGFILSLIALAFGWSAFSVFNVLLFSFAIGDLGGNLSKLIIYRRGG